jgi:outer membrane protein OmpA-like peptidoglycan-associated protein
MNLNLKRQSEKRVCLGIKNKAQFLCSISSCFFVVAALMSKNASALGVNAENYAPSAANDSALLSETPYTLPNKSWMLGLTSDYALRPVELGDGKEERVGVVDHLWMTHLSAGYGLTENIDFYGVLPFAFVSAHENPSNYLLQVGSTRDYFLLSDLRAGLKFKILEWGTSFAGTHSIAADLRVPSGNTEAMLSDGTARTKLTVPSSLFSTAGDWEISLTPGIIIWGDRERVVGDTGFAGGRRTLLARSWAASWDSSVRWTLSGTSRRPQHLGLEAGIKTEFSQGYIALNSAGNPWEWAVGARYQWDENLSLHGSAGTGFGRGVGSPLMRVMAGVRWSGGGVKEVESEESFDLRDVGKAYSDVELDRILVESRAEEQPRQLASDESLLRLMVEGQVVDIGYVRFKFNSADLSPEASKAISALMQRLLVEKPNKVRIEGHTDSVGAIDYNAALSKRRADAVKKALMNRGLEGNIVTTSGAGFRYPVASNATKQGRAANRRIEVSLDDSSFRKSSFTPAELKKFQEWIAPGGRRPTRD